MDAASGRLEIAGPVDAAALRRRLVALGHPARPAPGAIEADGEPRGEARALARWGASSRALWAHPARRRLLLAGLLTLPAFALGEVLGREGPLTAGLALAATVLAGWDLLPGVGRSLRARRIGIEVLMALAAAGALLLGVYVEAAMLLVLFGLGEALEASLAERAQRKVRSLMDLAPPRALLLARAGAAPLAQAETVPAAGLQTGDRIRLLPGAAVPVDAIVEEGRSNLSEAALTGEPLPVAKGPGDPVFAGTLNGEGALDLRVRRPLAESSLARMQALIVEALARRAPTERFIDRFAARYTPLVALAALLCAALPPLVWGAPFFSTPQETGWLYRSIGLLVIACPCALVIGTPATLVSAIARAARAGILVKGGAALEAMAQVRTMALDKTGTLTEGRPQVVRVEALSCELSSVGQQPPGAEPCCPPCRDLLLLADALERRSEHPAARAVLAAAARLDDGAGRYPEAQEVRALVGTGVAGQVAGEELLIASHRHFDLAIPHPDAHCQAARAEAAAGQMPLLVRRAGAYAGRITIADRLRLSSRAVLERLRGLGIRPLLLTGDAGPSAQAIAREVGLAPEEVRAGLLPADKLAALEGLRADPQRKGAVAMVGDGINDAPALAAADVGIAVGGPEGSAQAMENAAVVLMGGDLAPLPFAIALSRKALATVRANVALALGLKALAALALAIGWTGLWWAILADVGATVLVTLNGMRLLAYRDPLRPSAGA